MALASLTESPDLGKPDQASESSEVANVEELIKMPASKIKNTSETDQDSNQQQASDKLSLSNAILRRNRNDLVGKRILCLPKTFRVPTPSPVQISSRLWRPNLLGALREVLARDQEEHQPDYLLNKLQWCPKHHHHQDEPSYEKISQLIQKLDSKTGDQQSDLTGNKRVRSRNARQTASGNAQSGSQSIKDSSTSYSVMKTLNSRDNHHNTIQRLLPSELLEQQEARGGDSIFVDCSTYPITETNELAYLQDKTTTTTIATEVPRKTTQSKATTTTCRLCQVADDDNSCSSGPSSCLEIQRQLEQKLNNQQQYQHKHQDRDQSTAATYFSSLPWRIGTIRAVSYNGDDNNHSDNDDYDLSGENQNNSLSVMIEFDLLHWQTRDWYQVNGFSSSVSGDGNFTYKPDNKAGDNANKGNECNRQDDNGRLGDKQATGQTSTKAEDEGNLSHDNSIGGGTKPLDGDFNVVLIETSMCCLNRNLSPNGGRDLWPALVSI